MFAAASPVRDPHAYALVEPQLVAARDGLLGALAPSTATPLQPDVTDCFCATSCDWSAEFAWSTTVTAVLPFPCSLWVEAPPPMAIGLGRGASAGESRRPILSTTQPRRRSSSSEPSSRTPKSLHEPR